MGPCLPSTWVLRTHSSLQWASWPLHLMGWYPFTALPHFSWLLGPSLYSNPTPSHILMLRGCRLLAASLPRFEPALDSLRCYFITFLWHML